MSPTIKKIKISLSTEITLTLKTIITVFITIGTILWGYHEKVLLPQIESVKDQVGSVKYQVNSVDENVDWIMHNMAGLGGVKDSTVEAASKPNETDAEKTTGGLGSPN